MSWNFDKEGNEISEKLEQQRLERQRELDEFAEKMRSLIGKSVKDVLGDDSHGFVLVFDDGTMITATDSEYGENAIRFVTKEEIGVVG